MEGDTMAFLLQAKINDYEVRGHSSGTSKKGKEYMTLRIESQDGYTVELSCTDEDIFPDIKALKRGDIISCDVTAVSGKDRSYITLRSVPVVSGNAYGAGF